MDFLARREYGQQELIDKLAGKGFDRAVAEQAVGVLTGEGLQSDQRFAESFVQSRVNRVRGRSVYARISRSAAFGPAT